jgi:transglutaminase-like putative cysteine protease
MKPINVILVAILIFSGVPSKAQNPADAKYGKVAVTDFANKVYKIDSAASAVILADKGELSYVSSNKDGRLAVQFKRFTRIHILNKKGYDAATAYFILYKNEELKEVKESLKGITYNLENGAIVETKLKKENIFEENMDKNRTRIKYTLPNVVEGSIIDVEYVTTSDFMTQLPDWYFQSVDYPTLYSTLIAEIPNYFQFVFLPQGYTKAAPPTYKLVERQYNFKFGGASTGATERESVSTQAATYQWVKTNVPRLKEERFVTSLNNHVDKIAFQIQTINWTGNNPKPYLTSYQKLSAELLNDDKFAGDIKRNNNWINNEIEAIIDKEKDPLKKAKAIYTYIKTKFYCNENYGLFMRKNLKDVFKARAGNVTEINMLLIALLKHEGLACDPVILSTRSHGYTNYYYPLIDKFNYTICRLNVDNTEYFLDASNPNLGFGKLPVRCYNGHARVVNEDNPADVYFYSDSLVERKVTVALTEITPNKSINTSITTTMGYYESLNTREELSQTGVAAFKNTLIKNLGSDFTVTDFVIDSLRNNEQPVELSYQTAQAMGDADILYISPMMGQGYSKNPFQSENRFYPVEMPYQMNETFVLSLVIPEGYTVEELPKSTRVIFNEDEGVFDYIIQKSEEMIDMRCTIKINKTFFAPEDYNTLRDFFTNIVNKQAEQIVLKKKK